MIKLKDQVEVTVFILWVIVLGGTNAAFLSYIDETERKL